MESLTTPTSDTMYRSIWNECICEEFVDQGFGCILDGVSGSSSSRVDEIAAPSCTCMPPCQREKWCERVPAGSVPSCPHSTLGPPFASFVGDEFKPGSAYQA
ncbi:hypothetical protein NM688_g1354 [Phlebia brevispora]|uniref:Uncharacterized protein n=1 Tax=Phlebia brevispora TaxID=194682 RepID=A0ACC1TBZ4_9APHY|nr:hypothetical protein NM688_g1354 [Phlebia brevispora]